ncbi:hypothetical protein MTO96_021960 [Rhipicephalus appendiculatus]
MKRCSKMRTKKQHSSFDAGVVPEHIMQLCKSITNEQLVSKLRSESKHCGTDLVTAINDAGSQMCLPGFPRSDTHDILSLLLPSLVPSQQAIEGEANAKRDDKLLDMSSIMHTLGTTTRKSRLLQDTLVSDAVAGKTTVVAPEYNLADMDRLIPEDMASCTSREHLSSVPSVTVQEHQDSKFWSPATLEQTPAHAARNAGPENSQGESRVNLCPLRCTDDFESDASETDVPALHKQPSSTCSRWSDHDEDSPSLLDPGPCQGQPSSPHLPRPSCEEKHSKQMSVTFANPVHYKLSDQSTDENLLSATKDTQGSSQDRRHASSSAGPSPLGSGGLIDPVMSEYRSALVQDLPQDTERHIVRPVSPVEVRSPRKRRMRFTALQEEALVFGVMKYGRGSWKEIGDEGWFDGRRSSALSDKYRNLEMHGHLPKVKGRVMDMLRAGVNPLEKLYALYERHSLQRATSSTSEEPLHDLQCLPSHPQESRGASSVFRRLYGDSTATSSDDEDSMEPFQKRTEAREAVSVPEMVYTSSGGPSTSKAHLSGQSQRSSGSETDASQESVPFKINKVRRRVPFTPLEVEALVAGVLKFGKGNWSRILIEGTFLGRTGAQLSDKYRNLKQYRQLEAVEKAVKAKRERGYFRGDIKTLGCGIDDLVARILRQGRIVPKQVFEESCRGIRLTKSTLQDAKQRRHHSKVLKKPAKGKTLGKRRREDLDSETEEEDDDELVPRKLLQEAKDKIAELEERLRVSQERLHEERQQNIKLENLLEHRMDSMEASIIAAIKSERRAARPASQLFCHGTDTGHSICFVKGTLDNDKASVVHWSSEKGRNMACITSLRTSGLQCVCPCSTCASREGIPKCKSRQKVDEELCLTCNAAMAPSKMEEARKADGKASLGHIASCLSSQGIKGHDIAETIFCGISSPAVRALTEEFHPWLFKPFCATECSMRAMEAACVLNYLTSCVSLVSMFWFLCVVSDLKKLAKPTGWVRDLCADGDIESNPGPVSFPTRYEEISGPTFFDWVLDKEGQGTDMLSGARAYTRNHLCTDVNTAVIENASWHSGRLGQLKHLRIGTWTTLLYPTSVHGPQQLLSVADIRREDSYGVGRYPFLHRRGTVAIVIGKGVPDCGALTGLTYAYRIPITVTRKGEEDPGVVRFGGKIVPEGDSAALRALCTKNSPTLMLAHGSRVSLVGEWLPLEGNGTDTISHIRRGDSFAEAAVYLMSLLPWPWGNMSIVLETGVDGEPTPRKQMYTWYGATTVVPGELCVNVVLHQRSTGVDGEDYAEDYGEDSAEDYDEDSAEDYDEPPLAQYPTMGPTAVEFWPPFSPIPVNFESGQDYFVPASAFAASWALGYDVATINTVLAKIQWHGLFDNVGRWVLEAPLFAMSHAGIMATQKVQLLDVPAEQDSVIPLPPNHPGQH